MFSRFIGNNNTPSGFLSWWNEHPILLGGDRYSDFPGLAVCYIQHSNHRTFELRVEPVQQGKIDFTKHFLNQMLDNDETKHCIQLSITHDQRELATAELYVDTERRWAAGEGCWQELQGNPQHWELEYQVI